MPVSFNHVGIGVADIEEGVRYYLAALDCHVVQPPFDVYGKGPDGEQPVDVLKPPRFGQMRMAHLALPDGGGVELFQLIDPPHQPRVPQLEYWKSGIFHFSITDFDIERRLEKIVGNGGRQLSKIWLNKPPDKMMVYCCDPWGTIIEIYTHSYEDMYGSPA